jgi:hypothetical protein
MKKAVVAGIALAAVVAGAWLAFGRNEEPWPPEWYISPATDGAQHTALRRRAIATRATEFPPSKATLAYLRNLAVSSVLDPGEKLDDARVYLGSGYVLRLRGRFSTADIGPGPPGWKPPRAFEPCLTLSLDPSTLFAMSTSLGKCEDLSFLGDSVPLDLDGGRASPS